MDLQGQIAIVTGGSRGIGRATALELARPGADVVAAELDKAGAERTTGEVTGLGRRALALQTDVTRQPGLVGGQDRQRLRRALRREQGSLALAHAGDGIRVNRVCPGFVETDMWTTVSGELGASRAGYMTGQALSVDGGLVMH